MQGTSEMTFEIKRMQQRLADLEKGYKELSFWHDQWKKIHMITKESIVKSAELHSELNDTIKTMRQAILELAERVEKLEQKNTGKDPT